MIGWSCTFLNYPSLFVLALILCFSVNGQWGAFGSWSSCSQTCGGGIHTRQRECNNPLPSNGGLDCVGNATHQDNCNVDDCPPAG